MPLPYFPRAGEILVCDFSGFQPPEMVKKRPVVVVSPRLPSRSELVSIGPLSTTAPLKEMPYTVRLSRNYKPSDNPELPVWAKCDMLMNLSRERLNQFKVGRRKFEQVNLDDEDLQQIRYGILAALGFPNLFLDGK